MKFFDSSPDDIITRDAAHLAACEAGLGTVLHALHIPFAGHLLSLNQGAFLCHATLHSADRRTAALASYEIAGVAATLKSLSPALKKLGPMLSITMQAMLFSMAVLLFGKNRLGQYLGLVFLSTWAFLQPALTLLASFGFAQISEVVRFYSEKLNIEYHVAGIALGLVIGTLFLLKIIIAVGIVVVINRSDEVAWLSWQSRWKSPGSLDSKSGSASQPAFQAALRDLFKPLFLISFSLSFIFLFVQKDSLAEAVWLSLRPLAIAFVIFYVLRSPRIVAICKTGLGRIGFLRPIQKRLAKVLRLAP